VKTTLQGRTATISGHRRANSSVVISSGRFPLCKRGNMARRDSVQSLAATRARFPTSGGEAPYASS
jgi:hypothetical protein